jgi:ABC-type transporter Mla MlaB component
MARALALCAEKVQVDEGGDEIPPAAEEAAILYANGSDDEAREVLEAALKTPQSQDAREVLWTMLMDLARLAGQKERFESLSLMFAREFERSPPGWVDLSVQGIAKTAEPKVQTINLSGTLSGQAAPQFVQLIQVGMRAGTLRLDLSRLRGLDAGGAELLLRAVRGLRKARVMLYLIGAGQTASLLEGMVFRGRREHQNVWLLLLEVLQYTGDSERFEERALDYALTFEESPPSWEPPEYMTASQVEAAITEDEPSEAYVLEGEIVGTSTESIRRLGEFGNARAKVDVNCGRLRRMDFVSAGNLFNILSQLRTQGRLVVLKEVNSMVAALMQVMGIQQVASIELRP